MQIKDLIKAKVKSEAVKSVSGYKLYEGVSNIDGSNIVAIITLKSNNIKTGQMAQLWIMNADVNPIQASKEGKDKSVCGDCKLRQSLGGVCYVNLGQAPLAVFKAYKKGNYKKLVINQYKILNGLKIRFGAYGDPSAIPIEILTALKEVSDTHTSYTHQWRTAENLKQLSMASVDSIAEQKEAVKLGWRTFRVANENSELLKNEILCPNLTKGVNCADCNLCGGSSVKAKNIVILAHGKGKNRFVGE